MVLIKRYAIAFIISLIIWFQNTSNKYSSLCNLHFRALFNAFASSVSRSLCTEHVLFLTFSISHEFLRYTLYFIYKYTLLPLPQSVMYSSHSLCAALLHFSSSLLGNLKRSEETNTFPFLRIIFFLKPFVTQWYHHILDCDITVKHYNQDSITFNVIGLTKNNSICDNSLDVCARSIKHGTQQRLKYIFCNTTGNNWFVKRGIFWLKCSEWIRNTTTANQDWNKSPGKHL